MFIHWGSVSLKGTEIGWSRGGERRGYGSSGSQVPADVYDNLFRQFNPTNFNAAEWLAIAQKAGMKYMVFTSRHHDGFSMFDTHANDYKITHADSPFRRDVVKELADAAHAANFRFGLYYSQPNWQHPDAFTPDRHDRYLQYLKVQISELLTNYGRLDILWYDGLGKPAAAYDGAAMNRIARELQPHLVINNRNGLPEDHDTPEQRVGKYQDDRPWESCITICQQWAWKPDDQLKSLKECIQTLALCAGGDGNLLLNVGPMPDGRIEPRQVQRLEEIGAWLKQNGESIYGTRGGPWKPTKALASTRKGNTIYLHVMRWDADAIRLPALPAKVAKAAVLGGGKASLREDQGEWILNVPPGSRSDIDTVVALEMETSPMSLVAVAQGRTIQSKASNVYRKMEEEYGPEMAFDGNPDTRWATDSGTKTAWITADLGRPLTIHRVRIAEARGYENRVRKFEFQYRHGGDWKTLFAGTTLGNWFQKQFEPVTAREFRLSILDATDGPTFEEIEFYEK
jgi:alpha-L-fucosidase